MLASWSEVTGDTGVSFIDSHMRGSDGMLIYIIIVQGITGQISAQNKFGTCIFRREASKKQSYLCRVCCEDLYCRHGLG